MADENIGGPYLQMAVFCDRVLREVDGVASIIRVVDRWTVNGVTESMPVTVIPTNLVIMLKSGDYRGSALVTISPESPSGMKMPQVPIQMHLEGDNDRGVTVVSPLGFPVQEEGLYWFDVAVNGQVLTRMPFRVVYQRIVQGGSLPAPGHRNP